MFWVIITGVFLTFFSVASSQNCEKNSYLPRGLACKLDIFIRSEGQSDKNLTAPSGSSYLIVNGHDYSRKSRGINVAVFDQSSGRYMSGGVFDVNSNSAKATELRDFLQTLPNQVIIVMAIQQSGNANSNLNDAVSAMNDIGVNNTAILDKESFAAVLYKGPGSQTWVRESKNTVGNGPSFVSVSIPVPYGYIPEESLRAPFFNVAELKYGGKCLNSSTNSDANTICTKALDGSSVSEWVTKTEGIGAWISIGFASSYKINKVRLLQRTLSSAQSKDVRIDFSDCSTFAVSLTRDKGEFEEFTFSPRIASWVKLTVTSTHTSASNGFKEIEFYYDHYESDLACDQVDISSASTSKGYRLLESSIVLQIMSQKPVVILSTTTSPTGPRYEVILDDTNSTTYIMRSHDGSAVKKVAVSVARIRVMSDSSFIHVWLAWKAGRIAVGMGEDMILFYRDEQPLTVKYMFLRSPTSNAKFKLCGRKDYFYSSASYYWPLDKLSGGSLINLHGFKRVTFNGLHETTTSQGKTEGFQFIATLFDGTSTWLDLGDFKDTCVSDTDLCHDGLTVMLKFNRQGSGERYLISSGGQHTRGFAIYFPNSTTVRVEVRDSERRWLIEKSYAALGYLQLGFTWSRDLGLTVVFITSSISVERNCLGEMTISPADESNHLILGRPNNENAKYFQGSINDLVIFERIMTSESVTALLKGTGMSSFTDSCYKDSSASSNFLYYTGDINPEVLSPSVCRESCGKAYFTKAVLYKGSSCTCVNSTSSFVPVANDLCTVPCTGNAERKCGGEGSSVSVLNTITSTASIVCNNIPTTQEALTPFTATVQVHKPFYEPEKFCLEIGDGSQNEKHSSTFKHAFVVVENFTTNAKAVLKNNETGQRLIIECPNSVESFLPAKGFLFSCPQYVPTNSPFKCNTSFTQGSDVDIQVTWYSGSTSNTLPLPDSMLVSFGPEYMAQLPPANLTTPGMYILPHVGHHSQKTLVGFQLDVVNEGYLEIKCLNVLCEDSSQRFCPSQKACIGYNTICEPEIINCTSGSTLSMSSESCLRDSGSPSSSIHQPTVSSSNVNYKSKTNLIVWVNSGERNLIPLNNTVDVSECDFFAVSISSSPSAAVIATSYAYQSALYYPLSAINAANTNNGTFVGLHSPPQANGPQVKDTIPNVQLKFIARRIVTASYTYTSEGAYEAKAVFSGGQCDTNLIHVQDIISNVSFSSVPAAHPTLKASNVSLIPHAGTNVTYTLIFNDTNITTSTPWTMYTCKISGVHSIAVFARNKVSVSYTVCSMECQDEISGLEFTQHGLPTSAERESTRISWSLKNGSKIYFSINTGDESGVRLLNDSKVSGAIFVGTLNTTYSKAGVYTVNITACNKLGCESIQGSITIQEKVANVTMNAPYCMATNKSVNITANTQHGDMLNYAWTINNMTFKTNGQPYLIYTPSKAGIYNATVVVYNNVSTGLYSCKYIQVKDTVGGIEVGPVKPSGVGQSSRIPYKVNEGSDLRISICYGDGVCTDKNGTDKNGTFTHNYTRHGDYIANLTVCNCVGCNSSQIDVHVETPVIGSKVVVSKGAAANVQDNACSAPFYIKVNQTLFMVLTLVNGTNVKNIWDYGDGFNSSQSSLGDFNKNGMRSNHSYSKAGNYTLTAKPYNLNGHEVFKCHIVAQDPFTGLAVTSNSPQGIPNGLVNITVTPTMPRPSSPIHCVFAYGDKNTSAALPMSHNTQRLTTKHYYPFKGKFYGSVNCSNAIDYLEVSFIVELQDKIKGSNIKAYGTHPQKKSSHVIGEGYNGRGTQGTIFGQNRDIQFLTKTVNGSNLTCSFCFDCNGTEKVFKNSSCDNITHKFMTIGEKEVKVEVKNDVSSEIANVYVTIDDIIDCGQLTNDGPNAKGYPHIFTASPKNVGPNWCCSISYGDSSKPDYFVSNTSNCSNEFTLGFSGNVFHGNHTYNIVKEYKPEMECWNRVSQCKVPSKAVLSQIRCEQPKVSIIDLSPNLTSVTKIKRSVSFDIRTKNIIDCDSLQRSFKWNVRNASDKSNDILINMTSLAVTDKESFHSPPRTFKNGLYRLCFTLNMTEVAGIAATTCSPLRIIPSDLIADIVGGTEIAVGFNKTKVLDASNSRDPDTEHKASNDEKLRCYWFCKRNGDNYSLPISINRGHLPIVPKKRELQGNDSNNPDLGGCFGDGPGRLNTSSCNDFKVFTGEMLENTTYDIRLFVMHDDGRTAYKDQRWKIKQGDPPSMAIECHFNCKEKLNPSSKVSLSCYCTSCTSVNYQWEVEKKEEKNPGESKYVKLSKEELEAILTTPANTRSFSIMPNSLMDDAEYRFICKGRRGEKGTEGYAYYQKKANSKPRNGICDVTPRTGVALNTTFTITCSGWEDVDKPLIYTYASAQDCESKKFTILASDRITSKYKVESMPPGRADKNYTTSVRVFVSDVLKAINTSTCVTIQVREQKLDIAELGKMLNGTVKNLLASGSSSEVNQVVSSILSQVNQDSSSSSVNSGAGEGDGAATPPPTKSPAELEKEKQENTKIRGKIIGILGKVADTATNLNEVAQSSATLTNTINKPDELTDDAKKEAVSIIGKLTKAIESKSENAEPQEVEQAVQAVYAGISNCVDFVAASSPAQSKVASPTAGGTTDANNGYQQPQQKTISPEEKDAKRKLQNSITKTIESIAALLQKAKQPGEKPTTMKTKTMEMQISRERSKDLKNKSISVTGLSLTTNPQMFEGESEDNGGGKEPPAIDSTIVSSKKNIFSYDESAYLVEGGIVATIEFKNSSSRDSYIIQDLSTQFEMFVDRHSTQQHPVTVQLTTENLAFHQMNVTVNDTAIHLNVYPDSCDYGFEVFIKKGSFPSETNYDYNYTLPHDGQWDFDSNCSISSNRSSAFEIFMSNKYLNYTAAGLYFIGIRFKARKTEMFDILPVNYTVVMYTSSCMYWDEKKETWRADGCVVGPKSNPKKVQCLCNHMTSFSSSFITPPNKIDWNRIKNPDFSRASVCITTVFVVLAIYIICLIPARKADRRDAEKVGVSPLPDNDPRDTYCYEIHVHTGFMRGAGTSAEISVVLNGSVGESDPRVLKDPARKNFRTGGVDAFLMTAPQSLGSIKNVRIWHNNEGSYPSWNLLRIMIQDLQTEQRWWFVCDKWLAVDEGDGKIERILYPATSNELTKFNVLFATEVRKNLTDGHLWFSVVTRPARSTFTRVQRLTCCLSILYCTMLANIMFYRADQSQGPKESIQIAGYSFSLAQISTGIISSLIVFPSNLIVVQIFRKARAKDTNMNISSSYATTLDENDVEKAKEKEKPKKEGLPHWCVYLAYALALVTSLTSAVFVIFYGFTFGAEKSAQWLMSMTVSFIQDVLISQPIKVFLVASIFALLIKDPNKAESDPLTDANKLSTDEEWLHKNVKDLNNDEKENFKKLITDRPPDEAKLEIARQLRMKEKHMKSIIQELVWYMFFLLIILTISYGNRDPATFRITKYMNDIFLHSRYSGNLTFNKVKTINNYWKWLNETVVPSIYKDKWYNDHQSYPLGFLADTPTDFVLAVARLRQLRIKKNSCPYLPVFKQVIAECNDFYSPEDEDRRDLLPGWRIPSTNTSLSSKTAARKTAWEYQTGEELNTYPYWGYKATYDAGGYVEELPTNRKVKDNKTHAKVNDLHNLNWLDRYTRAIFTELSIYNANTNFFCVITLLFEQLPTGGLFNYPSILTLKLYRYVGGDMYFVLSCEIVYLLFTLYFIFRELKMVKKEGIGHFKNPWSMVEVFVTMLSFSLVVLYFVRMKFTAKAVGAMRKDHTKFISFHYTAFLDEWINALMGLVVFLSFLKVIRLLRFNRRMSLLAQTLKVCLPRIFAFLIIYGVAFFAYSQFACLVFGQSMEGFGTILRSSATLMDTILGKFALKELTDANRLIGPIFFYLYTVTMVFILINMFLSIINDSFAEVKNDVNKQPNEYEIVNFMVHRLKENIGKTMGNAIMPIYKEPKSKLEKDFDCIEEHADNIMHYMRNMTFENMRHTRWFDAETSKEKKKKMFEILMEVDWDYFEDELGDAIPVFEEFLNKYDEEKLEDVHQAYRYKKMREQEMESKFTTRESDQEEESSDDSDEEDPSDQSDTNNDDNPGDEYDLIEAPKYGTARQSIIPSPAHSIRSIYSPSSSKTPLLLNSPKPLKSHPVTPDMGKAKYLAPHGPQASESELSDILHDIERKRCATDAELNSFLPEVKSLDDNNVPKYDSDPEQVTTKSKKKKKPKKLTSMKSSTVSIKSKAAWTESEEKSRHSPAGSSDRERILPDGAEKDSLNNFGQDNQGFENEVLSGKKDKKKKKKEQKSTIDNIDWESMS